MQSTGQVRHRLLTALDNPALLHGNPLQFCYAWSLRIDAGVEAFGPAPRHATQLQSLKRRYFAGTSAAELPAATYLIRHSICNVKVGNRAKRRLRIRKKRW